MTCVALSEAVYTRLKLRVPALQSITLEMSEPAALALPGAATTVSQLSNWIMECLQLGSEKLQRIVIVQSKAPSAADVRALLAFAEKLYLDDGAITQELSVPPDEELDGDFEGFLQSLLTLTD
ncbi:hypothetical protein AURDEDRAFT_131844 [Auricularia subglabra TFB-10046 SS5]|uniref:Uncharacterized protein n=1 Tax=Auricularia subglabra (strain TFB-10046 / SS5) TaxID=717982 RepID=J0WMS6_AURST|nr:hypothetical protein AURDEDRAFT_131844 [Auricularia subglabra TFB-10046 SS5]